MSSKNTHTICLIPVFNDWESCNQLLSEIAMQGQQIGSVEVVVVNDGSSDVFSIEKSQKHLPLTILNLTLNVGHQRAIAIGLAYIYNHSDNWNYVVVMDSDGEDCPSDIGFLLNEAQENNNNKIVFAKRQRRTEGLGFRLFYMLYKTFFHILTGEKLNFGNFSCIPKHLISKIIAQPAIWNHYSGSIIKSKLPFTLIPLDRGRRYFGQSKMNMVSLIVHGLSAISIYIEIVTVRLLLFSFLGISVAIFAIVIVFAIKTFTVLAVPGWASNISLLIFNIVIQLSIVSLLILLLILYNRNTVQLSLNQLYKEFLESVEKY